jgi:hypothetical protein
MAPRNSTKPLRKAASSRTTREVLAFTVFS